MARALACDREARFSSAKEMADELRRAAGMPSVMPPSGHRTPLVSPIGPSTPTRVSPLGPDAPTRVDGLPPSSATRMDATLTDAPTLVTPRTTPLWKPALLVLATAFAIGLGLLARAALREPPHAADSALGAPPPAQPAAPKAAASASLPVKTEPSAHEARPAEAPEPRRVRTQGTPAPSGASGRAPPREPEDYGF
jgi:hypothetical protein